MASVPFDNKHTMESTKRRKGGEKTTRQAIQELEMWMRLYQGLVTTRRNMEHGLQPQHN